MVALAQDARRVAAHLWQLMGDSCCSPHPGGGDHGPGGGERHAAADAATAGDLLPADLPLLLAATFALGIAVAFFITLLLAFVPFLRLLPAVPPLRVLRRELEAGILPG